MGETYAIEMLGITKKFPGIIANENVTIQLKKGEIHALLGENGAGKSTLMSVLFGLYVMSLLEKKDMNLFLMFLQNKCLYKLVALNN